MIERDAKGDFSPLREMKSEWRTGLFSENTDCARIKHNNCADCCSLLSKKKRKKKKKKKTLPVSEK